MRVRLGGYSRRPAKGSAVASSGISMWIWVPWPFLAADVHFELIAVEQAQAFVDVC